MSTAASWEGGGGRGKEPSTSEHRGNRANCWQLMLRPEAGALERVDCSLCICHLLRLVRGFGYDRDLWPGILVVGWFTGRGGGVGTRPRYLIVGGGGGAA